MNYLIGRDIDNDGYPEFIQNMNTMSLTEDPSRALQFTAGDLEYIDMTYLNSLGFYAVEAPRYGVSLIERLLFKPPVRAYRPPVAPPPRRRGPGMPPHPAARGPVGGPAPRGPVGSPAPRGPVNMGPGGAGRHEPSGRGMGGPGGHGPSGRGMGGPGTGGPGGHGPSGRGGMGGPGGRGPGR